MHEPLQPDEFELYDLRVTVEGDPNTFVCRHRPGEQFLVEGEDLVFPAGEPQRVHLVGIKNCHDARRQAAKHGGEDCPDEEIVRFLF